MSPISKAHAYSFTLATTATFTIWQKISVIQTNSLVKNICIALILSFSFYRMILNLILFLCKNTRIIRKFLLGKSYFEGLWIGYYIVDNAVEYYYEVVEQDLENLSIKGKSFDNNHKFIGTWNIINPTFNVSESKLTYYYEMDIENSECITSGYSRSVIYRDRHGIANEEIGFAVDNTSLKKQYYFSKKICRVKNIQDWLSQNFWEQADELYKTTSEFIQKQE